MSRIRPNELIPNDEIIDAIISQAIAPLIRRFERQLKEPVPTAVVFYSGTSAGTSRLAGQAAPPHLEPRGEVRVRCRPTFVPGRLLFLAEAIYRNVAPGSGFSGFRMTGEARQSESSTSVTVRGWTGRYNIWEWEVRDESADKPW